MSQAGHDKPKDETVKCACGEVHSPSERQRVKDAVKGARNEIMAYLDAHGEHDPAIGPQALLLGLCEGNASPLVQKAAGVMLLEAMNALKGLPAELVNLLLDPNARIVGHSVKPVEKEPMGFKVPGLSELLPKKTGNREDN
jgi:hypothetical protein